MQRTLTVSYAGAAGLILSGVLVPLLATWVCPCAKVCCEPYVVEIRGQVEVACVVMGVV